MAPVRADQFDDAEEDTSASPHPRPGRDASATYLDDEVIVDPSVEAEENIAAVQVRQRLEQMGLAGDAASRDPDAETEVGIDGIYVPSREGRIDEDEEGIHESWSDYSDEGDYGYDEDGNPLDEGNIDDEDWEVAEGDFTKQYNRMRRHLQIVRALPTQNNGLAAGIKGEADPEADMPLPARNVRTNTTRPPPPRTGPSVAASKASAVQEKSHVKGKGREVEESDEAVDADVRKKISLAPRANVASYPHIPTSIAAGQSTANPLLATRLGVSSAPKHSSNSANQKDKADRATVEQVLDSRTRAVLVSLVRKGLVSAVQGCVSTGKEANVYFAPGPTTPPVPASASMVYPSPYPTNLALKIYKTSILSFKTRSQYIAGSHRFRNAYTKVTNPRKMVRVWAEKELRNLRRLADGGVRCPKVVECRENVLVMEFLGGQGDDIAKTSPRLKDADIPPAQLPELYAELAIAMRFMYQRCHLVHADFSEYNILYHLGHAYIIDVSQSVEHDHQSAFDFLRSDIKNLDDFFKKRSGGEVRTLGIRGTFDFIVNERVTPYGAPSDEKHPADQTEEDLKEIVRSWLDAGVGSHDDQKALATSTGAATSGEATSHTSLAQDDAVFMSSYIPRTLGEVYDPERDIDLLSKGKGDDLIYAGLTGLNTKSSEAKGKGKQTQKGDDQAFGKSEQETGSDPIPEKARRQSVKSVRFEDEENEDTEEDTDGSDDEEGSEKKSRGFRHEDREAKKDRKKALKEENREKRKNKMPKAEKQRKIKTSKSGK
ncbi:hypothetical protein QFC19_001804 [Naganishia cerealis]|uniref:Uncharacterized protein n=1 Tax=Naganishia cerealis TaxID=610337 RepID=A0ACC2WFE7_9TREE|nr:hypothetical protein QFC19_001804 [Naganishia cerealis]